MPDLLLWHAGESYALELKAEAGSASEAQRNMLGKLSAAGVHTAIAHGLDRALAVLESWQLLRGREVTTPARCPALRRASASEQRRFSH